LAARIKSAAGRVGPARGSLNSYAVSLAEGKLVIAP
jgi:hypothetical protein